MILETNRDQLFEAILEQSQTVTPVMDAGIEIEFYPTNKIEESQTLRVVGFELTDTEFEFTLEDGQTIRQTKEGYKASREEDGYTFILDNGELVFWVRHGACIHRKEVQFHASDVVAYGMATPVLLMEEARVEMFQNHGLTPALLEQFGLDFMAAEIEMEYPEHALDGDFLEVRTQLLRLDEGSLALDQSIRRLTDNILCYDAFIKLVCVSTATGKPDRIPKDLRKLIGVRPLTNE